MENSVDGPIVNKFRWTPDDVFEGQRALIRCRGGGFPAQVLKTILFKAIVVVFGRLLKLGWDLLILYFASVGFGFLFIPLVSRQMAQKHLAKRQESGHFHRNKHYRRDQLQPELLFRAHSGTTFQRCGSGKASQDHPAWGRGSIAPVPGAGPAGAGAGGRGSAGPGGVG